LLLQWYSLLLQGLPAVTGILSRKVHTLSQPGLPPLQSERSGGREVLATAGGAPCYCRGFLQ